MKGKEFGGPDHGLGVEWKNPDIYNPDVDEINEHNREVWKGYMDMVNVYYLGRKMQEIIPGMLEEARQKNDQTRILELESNFKNNERSLRIKDGEIAIFERDRLDGFADSDRKIQSVRKQKEEETGIGH